MPCSAVREVVTRSIKRLILAVAVTAVVAVVWHMTPMSKWNFTMLRRDNWWVKFYSYYYVYMCLSLAVSFEFVDKQKVGRILASAFVLSMMLYSFAMQSLMFGEGILAQHFTLWYISNGMFIYSCYSVLQMMYLMSIASFLMLRLMLKRFPLALE